MFGFFKKRPTSNLQLIAGAIDEARRQAAEAITGEASLFIDTVFEGVERAVGDHRQRADKALAEGMTPLHLVTLMARNHSYQELSTGRHMVYRGVLSMQGHGYMAMFRWSSGRMVEFGDLTVEQAEQEQADVRTMIKELG